MIVRYAYKNYSIKYADGVLSILCCPMMKGVLLESVTREYDIPYVDHISFDGEYVYLMLEDNSGFIQLKLESDSEIVLDKFDLKSEFIDSVGCHDFVDDFTHI